MIIKKIVASALVLSVAAAVLAAVFSSPAASQISAVVPLDSSGCSDGTFVDTEANPAVTGPNNDLIEDCQALVAIQNHWASYAANNNLSADHPLRTWGTGTTQKIDSWDRVALSSGRVAILNLHSYKSGTLSSESVVFPDAENLNPGPGISGTLPTEIGNLSALTDLTLSNNLLSGTIPTEIANLANVNWLLLDNNFFSGTIPTELGNLTNLTDLSLSGNRLTGPIPTEFGNLTRLDWLIIHKNLLSGTIPTELGNLTSLSNFRISQNLLTGSIPAEIADLSTTAGGRLWRFAFCDNYLSGELPVSFRTGVTLIGYPSEGPYDPIGCQNTGTPSSAAITALASSGCSDGTFVDTSANPAVTGTNNDLVEDCQALVAIQNHWAADAANNYLQAEHPLRTWGTGTTQKIDAWDGITVSSVAPSSNRVTAVNLNNTSGNSSLAGPGIRGTIPSQLANLTELLTLEASWNKLSGGIPARLSQLSKLEIIDFRGNRLTGPIPIQLRYLTNLRHLYLSNNSLTGNIPAQLGQLTNLRGFLLHNNRLIGNIPAQLGQLANLTDLRLRDNRLTGNIPAQLGQLTNLTRLWLYDNLLSGNIPAQLSRLTNLTSLRLQDNWLTGSIPADLGNLAPSQGGQLADFHFCNNYLTGAVPTALQSEVDLGSYPTSGGYDPVACQYYDSPPTPETTPGTPTAPGTPTTPTTPYTPATPTTPDTAIPTSTTGNIPLLAAASCADGAFVDTTTSPLVSGENNDLVEDCRALVAIQNYWAANVANDSLNADHPLRTWGTSTSEKIDTWDGITVASNRVAIIDLGRQSLSSEYSISGTIPTQIGNLSALTALLLRFNRLTGPIPTQLGNLASLNNLQLHDNRLTGPIPTQLGYLTSLRSLWLRDNQLTGPIPTQLGDMSSLGYIYLQENQITGPIPTQLGYLTNLDGLYLGDNQLTGSIPTQLGNLGNLRSLAFNDNLLTGSIPDQLGDLAPSQGGSLTRLALCRNYLTGAMPTPLQSVTNIVDYPTGEFDPLACQREVVLVPPIYPPPDTEEETPQDDDDEEETPQDDDEEAAQDDDEEASQDDEEELGPNAGTRQFTLTRGWNILTLPQTIQRRDGSNFLFASQLIDCQTSTGVIAIVTYNPTTGRWSLWLPCHARAERSLTTGENASFQPLTVIRPRDFTYIYYRDNRNTDIEWDSDTQTYRAETTTTASATTTMWNTFVVSETGTTIEQIRTALGISRLRAVYRWDAQGQSWQQITESPRQGDIILVRISQEPSADILSELNLQRGTQQATLAQGWNIITLPETITRTQGQAFLLDNALTDCSASNRAAIIMAYKPQTQTWGLWIPCNPQQQAAHTTGQSPDYEVLNSIAPSDITYIYARANQPLNIAWNAAAKTYQPS